MPVLPVLFYCSIPLAVLTEKITDAKRRDYWELYMPPRQSVLELTTANTTVFEIKSDHDENERD